MTSLQESITPFFDREDVKNFQDKTYKKQFIDKLEKETGKNRKSIDIVFNQMLKKRIKEDGLDPNSFGKAREKKFNTRLDLQTKTEKVRLEREEGDGEKKAFPQNQNARAGRLQGQPPQPLPMGALAGSVNSFLSAIWEDMEEMTDSEKEDVSACMNFAFGDYFQTHDAARKVFGVVGIIGVYGGKIKKARKIKKEKKEKEQQDVKAEMPVITEQAQQDFDQKTEEYFLKDDV